MTGNGTQYFPLIQNLPSNMAQPEATPEIIDDENRYFKDDK